MKKIMIVDDSLEFLEVLSISLSKKFKIYTALGVTEAINICKEEEIDVICSDLYMGNDTGYELLLKMKQQHMNVPFILMSASEDALEIKLAEQHGAIFISKTDSSFLNKIIDIANGYVPTESIRG